MQLRETITLSSKPSPFPKPLPRPAEEYINLLSSKGLKFEKQGWILLLNEPYLDIRLPLVEKLVADNHLDLRIQHSMWTVYDDKDYENNPLWILLFPEIHIEGVNFTVLCKTCNRTIGTIKVNKKVASVKSKKPIVTVNAQFRIVNKFLKDKISSELKGARFEPFDEKGEYYVLIAKKDLGELINPASDYLDYKGRCPECNLPNFKMFFSPFKYLKSNWNQEDIMSGEFHEGLFFTKKAFDLFKSVEKDVIKTGVVILEEPVGV